MEKPQSHADINTYSCCQGSGHHWQYLKAFHKGVVITREVETSTACKQHVAVLNVRWLLTVINSMTIRTVKQDRIGINFICPTVMAVDKQDRSSQ